MDTRVSGNLGTVEEAYKARKPKPYLATRKPKDFGETHIRASIPSERTRTKREEIRRQQTKPKKKAYGGSYLWVQYLGYSSYTHSYGLRVKIRGVPASDYWLPYDKANNLWYDITNETLKDT